MKTTLKTAIITRTKNRPVLFERAVACVASQTSKEYIHVVLNDGGDKAEVEAILAKYPDENRVVFHNAKSVGLTKALNQAIQSVKSDLVAILDDDDTWHPERIEKVTQYFNKHKDTKAVAVTMERVLEEIKDNAIIEMKRESWYEGVFDVSLYDQLLDNYLTNNCITYTRSAYNELKGYDESLEVAEDWDFGIRLLLKYDVTFLPEVLAYYHHRPTDMSVNGNSVFAGLDAHTRSLVKLRNKYLRDDLAKGVFGVGYIMNSLNAERERYNKQKEDSLNNVVRLEGHINYSRTELESKIEHIVDYHAIDSRVSRKIKGAFKKSR